MLDIHPLLQLLLQPHNILQGKGHYNAIEGHLESTTVRAPGTGTVVSISSTESNRTCLCVSKEAACCSLFPQSLGKQG